MPFTTRLPFICQAGRFTCKRFKSIWSAIAQGPSDAIFGVAEAFGRDRHPKKINLSVGAYRDDHGSSLILPSVREAEHRVLAKYIHKEYTGITGLDDFVTGAAKLAYGPLYDENIVAVQSLSGTGALRVGAAFIRKFNEDSKEIWIPSPTWSNHQAIFSDAGLEVRHYRYLKSKGLSLDVEGMMEDLSQARSGSVVLFHACAHNPTGIDPSQQQWLQAAQLVQDRNLISFFDMAYQGFSSGNCDVDSYAVRLFVDRGLPILLSQSFAKTMGLYGERVGLFSLTTDSPSVKAAVESQLRIIIRALYSSPPIHGARIAAEILNHDPLRSQWLQEVEEMATRIRQMRLSLRSRLEALGSSIDWSHITLQTGMFSYTGLSSDQVRRLACDYAIYGTQDGRISMASINSGNVDQLACAIHEVTR